MMYDLIGALDSDLGVYLKRGFEKQRRIENGAVDILVEIGRPAVTNSLSPWIGAIGGSFGMSRPRSDGLEIPLRQNPSPTN